MTNLKFHEIFSLLVLNILWIWGCTKIFILIDYDFGLFCPSHSHCYFISLNIKKMGLLQFCLPVLLGIHRNPKQKDFLIPLRDCWNNPIYPILITWISPWISILEFFEYEMIVKNRVSCPYLNKSLIRWRTCSLQLEKRLSCQGTCGAYCKVIKTEISIWKLYLWLKPTNWITANSYRKSQKLCYYIMY